MSASGALYCVLNALLRQLSQGMNPFQVLALVYAGTLVVMAPVVWRTGPRNYIPQSLAGLCVRGAVHWVGMCLWMLGVTGITLAETTAIGFTSPLFVMLGGAALLGEPLRAHRVVATVAGFIGVLVVLAPRLVGGTNGGGSTTHALLMLASAGAFAGSFLLSKRLTRVERAAVIVVWQSVVVTILSVPLAVLAWQPPTAAALGIAFACGLLTTVGNYCLTRAFTATDISASQPAKFLDLIWASALGWLMFGDPLAGTTIVGAVIILVATLWVAHRDTSARGSEAARRRW